MLRIPHRLLVCSLVLLPLLVWGFGLSLSRSSASGQGKSDEGKGKESQTQAEPSSEVPPPSEAPPEEPLPKEEGGKVKKGRYDDLQFYAYASGLTGIFDRSSGRLYIYDTDLAKCIAIRQLGRLGEPLRKLK